MTTITAAEFLNEVKFRNAVRRAGVAIANKSEYGSNYRLQIRAGYDADFKTTGSAWAIKNGITNEPIWFEFYGLNLEHAIALSIAGFEVTRVRIFEGGSSRDAVLYRKSAN